MDRRANAAGRPSRRASSIIPLVKQLINGRARAPRSQCAPSCRNKPDRSLRLSARAVSGSSVCSAQFVSRKDVALRSCRGRASPVFPWEVAIPGLKSRVRVPLCVVGRHTQAGATDAHVAFDRYPRAYACARQRTSGRPGGGTWEPWYRYFQGKLAEARPAYRSANIFPRTDELG